MYIKSNDISSDGVLFCYTVKIDRRSPRRSTFTHTDLNVHISPQPFTNGSQSNDFDLQTLNYLM